MRLTNKRTLWLRWVVANAFGELFGLGVTFAVIALAFSQLTDQQSLGIVLVLFLFAVASGAIEAPVVGLAQWWAMSPWFPTITRRAWWLATLAGALVAYILGYLPSTLMNIREQTSQTPMMEPPQGIILLFAAGLGAIAGMVLSSTQWLAMRNKVAKAGWWIPANMLAWMVGMPIIFWGIDVAQKGRSPLLAALLLAGVLFLTGAVIGAIHGAFLVRLADRARID